MEAPPLSRRAAQQLFQRAPPLSALSSADRSRARSTPHPRGGHDHHPPCHLPHPLVSTSPAHTPAHSTPTFSLSTALVACLHHFSVVPSHLYLTRDECDRARPARRLRLGADGGRGHGRTVLPGRHGRIHNAQEGVHQADDGHALPVHQTAPRGPTLALAARSTAAAYFTAGSRVALMLPLPAPPAVLRFSSATRTTVMGASATS